MFEVIHSYTRSEAIEDGVLVDMTAEPFGALAQEAGIKWPVAMTSAAFAQLVKVEDVPGHMCQDEKGRYWDVLWMFRQTRRTVSPVEARWTVFVRDTDGELKEREVKCISGPDDAGEPCLTFMLPDED